MTRAKFSLRLLLGLAIAAGTVACDSGSDPLAPTTAPDFPAPSAAFTTSDDGSAVIDSDGGFITLGAHYLWVPPNAVSQPTTFTMTEGVEDASVEGIVGVTFTAADATGPVTHFDRTLVASLSYAGVDISKRDARRLTLVYDDGSPVPSWSIPGQERVTGYIDHFSGLIIKTDLGG